jgi:hypothetical protein
MAIQPAAGASFEASATFHPWGRSPIFKLTALGKVRMVLLALVLKAFA